MRKGLFLVCEINRNLNAMEESASLRNLFFVTKYSKIS
jgi:hypothetical protein